MARTAKPAAFTVRVEDPPPPVVKERPLGEWEARLKFVDDHAPDWCAIAELPTKAACGSQARAIAKRHGNRFEFDRREVVTKAGSIAFRIYARSKRLAAPETRPDPADTL